MGILLLIPVFLPDVNQSAADVILTKKEPMMTLYHIRILQGLLLVALFWIGFLIYLKRGECMFSVLAGMLTLFANTCFLGGIGMLAFSLTDQIVFAYMILLHDCQQYCTKCNANHPKSRFFCQLFMEYNPRKSDRYKNA